MEAQIPELLEALAARARDWRVPPAMRGVICLEAVDVGSPERWYLTLDKDGVRAAGEGTKPVCVVRADRATLHAVLSGETSMIAAVLRGALAIEGQVMMLAFLRRLVPEPETPSVTSASGDARRQT